ncbi:Sodium-coupled neutral amino acid transporter 9 homolog [Eumeta japonica]|uniref:Sodium-coupled neutral amino acid transporter 9 homolog n=1 Tax=Eumeta variegata TaxID=151549 RepID=A0A4C1ZZ68_EUMVA|nr:Sodium-coupled neutral amino acid transporter 9 homolog [Eumeta japonica]
MRTPRASITEGRCLRAQNAMEPLLSNNSRMRELQRVYGSTPMSDDSLQWPKQQEQESRAEPGLSNLYIVLRGALKCAHATTWRTAPSGRGPADFKSAEILDFYKRERSHNPQKKKQSSVVTIFSVWNTMLGSSLLAMAWGVGRAGLVSALLLTAAMGALCLFTAYLLLTVKNKHGGARCEVPALCRVLLGRWAELLAHAFSLLVLLGANVVYWILLSNFLYFTVNYITDILFQRLLWGFEYPWAEVTTYPLIVRMLVCSSKMVQKIGCVYISTRLRSYTSLASLKTSPNSMALRRLITEFLWPPSSSIIRR